MIRFVLTAMLLSLVLTASAAAQERAVWRLGEFDGSADEFNTPDEFYAVDPVPMSRPFVIPASRITDWAGSQRAVTPAEADRAGAQATIRFELPDAPLGSYELRLGLIVKTARVPVVQIDVNGHKGWFYQRIETDYEEGNREGMILPQYAIGSITAEMPASFFKQGANEIRLTAVADPIASRLPGGEVMSNAVLTYDALALSNDPGARLARGIVSAEATPTVFYKQEGARLMETVSVLVRCNEIAPREIKLSLPGWSDTRTLAGGREFGEERAEFSVPEFAAGAQARINVSADETSRDFSQQLNPSRKWTVHIIPHQHLDIGYSDFQTKLAELHSRAIDDAMTLSDEHPEFSFSLDGSWQASQFLEGRSEAEKQRFYKAVRERKIVVPAQHAIMLTGFPTAEALLRSFLPAHKLNREHGGMWSYANSTDVPSYSWSYASILAASGLKYFAAAANADRGPVLMLGDLHRRSPFWWEGPDGSRVLMWYARHYHQAGSEFGLPTRIATGYEGLATFLHTYDRPDYPANHVLLYGSQWENTSLYPEQARLAAEWNNSFPYPRLRFDNFPGAMEQIAGEMKDKLPVVRGDGGPYWEDGIASDARAAAIERETERRAASAEKLGTIASLVDERFRPSGDKLDTMWENIRLMDEHTWGWGRSVTEPHSEDSTRELAYKRAYGAAARDAAEYLLDRSMTAIAGQIDTPQRALVVFNTLNWQRDGFVEFDLQKTRELVDAETNQVVGFDVLHDEPAYQRIRFLARDIPAIGYRTYAVRDKAASAAPSQDANRTGDAQTNADQFRSGVLENSFYRVTLDRQTGEVRGIYDKQLGRELVDASSPYRFNQYVYVTGGDDFPNQLLTFRKASPYAKLTTHTATDGKLISINRTPFGIVARTESRAVNTPRIASEIILFDREKKIAFNNRVVKDEIYKKEAAYFAFPLALSDPQFRYEVQSAVVDPARDMIPGANLEWFSSHNWASASDPSAAISITNLDSFLWTFGDIVRGTYPTEFGKRAPALFSYAMNNYWNTNYIAAQGGEFAFRYVLTSAPSLDISATSRRGWEETTPLERILIKSQDQTFPVKRTLPAAKMSFLQVDNPDVVLSAWKRAEDGTGYVLRFIEQAGRPAEVAVSSPLLRSATASNCNAMEECGETLRTRADGFAFEIKPRQILTAKTANAKPNGRR